MPARGTIRHVLSQYSRGPESRMRPCSNTRAQDGDFPNILVAGTSELTRDYWDAHVGTDSSLTARSQRCVGPSWCALVPPCSLS